MNVYFNGRAFTRNVLIKLYERVEIYYECSCGSCHSCGVKNKASTLKVLEAITTVYNELGCAARTEDDTFTDSSPRDKSSIYNHRKKYTEKEMNRIINKRYEKEERL
tara:strand:- start:321 stop:641 length:321 start_codon:yes stop_codon:yes gene_type:complete